jgi:predicted metal-dependent peptidase
VTVIVGDDQVRLVQSFKPGRSNLRELVFEGGGNTDFSPLLREADRHRPDMGVFLTDLQGPAKYRPAWPVLWVVLREWEHAEAPYGRKLVLD